MSDVISMTLFSLNAIYDPNTKIADSDDASSKFCIFMIYDQYFSYKYIIERIKK